MNRILCAVDRSELAPTLYRHGAGLAAATGASLAIACVTTTEPDSALADAVRAEYFAALPRTSYTPAPDIRIRAGRPVETLHAIASEWRADLLVAGCRRRGPVAAWLLGSTSRGLLQSAQVPLLLLADNELDIVTLGTARPHLHFGSVVAAIDLREPNDAQLQLAGDLALLARQRLVLMTVVDADDDATEHAADAALRKWRHGLETTARPTFVVRRGDVTEEIVRCAHAEDAGLVVLGLHRRARGARPGRIASAVLQTGRTAVVAVPDRGSVRDGENRPQRHLAAPHVLE